MRLQIVFLAAVYLCAAGVAHGQKPSTKPAASLIEDARAAMTKGDNFEAVRVLDQAQAAADVSPVQRPVITYLRGVAHYRNENVLGALSNFHIAVADAQLPADMKASAEAAIGLLSARAASLRGGAGGYGFSYDTYILPDDLARREHELANPRSEEERDPDLRSEKYSLLAYEYASRGDMQKARLLGAQSLSEARRSGSAFREGDALMRMHLLAQMQDDEAAASNYLAQGVAKFEAAKTLRIVPGYLMEGIKNSESRRDMTENCRHRRNLDRLYVRIDGADLAEEAKRNASAMQANKCPA